MCRRTSAYDSRSFAAQDFGSRLALFPLRGIAPCLLAPSCPSQQRQENEQGDDPERDPQQEILRFLQMAGWACLVHFGLILRCHVGRYCNPRTTSSVLILKAICRRGRASCQSKRGRRVLLPTAARRGPVSGRQHLAQLRREHFHGEWFLQNGRALNRATVCGSVSRNEDDPEIGALAA